MLDFTCRCTILPTNMEWASNEVIGILSYLLPGFVSAWIFYGLTSYPKPAQFERIIHALIFTIITQVCVIVMHWLSVKIGKYISSPFEWNDNVSLVVSILIAIIIGLFFARFANNDKIHKCLRKMKFTKETSYPSEWFGAFNQQDTYIVLHLVDSKRLYGWPVRWPSVPNEGHFSIAEAEWLDEKNDRIKLDGVSNILIPTTEVKYIEFMKIKERGKDNE
ncbi:hypothetical protein ES705_10265 [subsurface metagenome]